MGFQMREERRVVPSTDLTGITAVTTAGTEVTLGTATNEGGFWLQGHTDNTKPVWVMFKGEAKTAGYPIKPGEQVHLNVTDLSLLDVDSEVNGEKVCWLKA